MPADQDYWQQNNVFPVVKVLLHEETFLATCNVTMAKALRDKL